MTKRKTENRGGARPGAGRPRKKKVYDEEIKRNYHQAAKELCEEFGESVEKAILRLIYLKGTQDSVKIAAGKLYSEVFLIKTREQISADKTKGPAIRLPPTKPDPAKVIQMEEKQAEKSAGGV